jgi:hypothetical protein
MSLEHSNHIFTDWIFSQGASHIFICLEFIKNSTWSARNSGSVIPATWEAETRGLQCEAICAKKLVRPYLKDIIVNACNYNYVGDREENCSPILVQAKSWDPIWKVNLKHKGVARVYLARVEFESQYWK